MARRAKIEREKHRAKLSKKFSKLRSELQAVISSLNSTSDERLAAQYKLQSLPRDSSKSRGRNRCRLCGRSRAYNRLTGLCRIHMRAAVMNGLVPGMHLASW